MNNLIAATLSGLIVSVVGAWIIKRFGGASEAGDTSRRERRSTYNSVHVRIDAEFVKVVAWLFGLIAFSLFVVYTMYTTDRSRIEMPDFASTQKPIIATTTVQGFKIFTPTPPPPVSYPPIVGDPLQVQFAPGSYGAVISVKQSTRYLLWAKAGQFMTLTTVGDVPGRVSASIYAPNGVGLHLDGGAVLLPIDGNYTIDVYTQAPFSLAIKIQ
ncbi:MAG: hypothetical protein R3C14_45605 [Caldilineaceae bacterium]